MSDLRQIHFRLDMGSLERVTFRFPVSTDWKLYDRYLTAGLVRNGEERDAIQLENMAESLRSVIIKKHMNIVLLKTYGQRSALVV